MDSEGSRRLIQTAAEMVADQTRGKPLSPEQVRQRRRTALRLNLARYLKTGYHGPRWTAEELALLGTDADEVIASRIGRTRVAVQVMRNRRGMPRAKGG
jgi:hypothetical protein